MPKVFCYWQLYNEHLDNKGHDFGPNSSELKKALEEVDVQLNKFLQKLTERNLDDKVRHFLDNKVNDRVVNNSPTLLLLLRGTR